MGSTVIRVSIETWKKLTDLKESPSQSYEDVILKMMQIYEEYRGDK